MQLVTHLPLMGGVDGILLILREVRVISRRCSVHKRKFINTYIDCRKYIGSFRGLVGIGKLRVQT
jgi:hypothetical protein